MKGQVILKNLQWLGRHNPGFAPGSTQTAVAELLNPTSSILPYSGHLLIGRPTVAGSGRAYFNIDAGATKNVNFILAMPTAEGTYPVYLDIFYNDELLEDYRAAEDVVIGAIKYTLDIAIEPPGAGYVTKSPSKATYSAGEVVTLTAHPHSGYEFDHWGGWPPYPGVGSTSPTLNITMDSDWWVVAAFREAAPVTTLTVALKNPPSGATKWQISVIDWGLRWILSWGTKEQDNIRESAIFNIPPEWSFPLRISIAIYQKLNGSRQLYRVQSWRPIKPFTTDEPDPTYKEIFIPELGSYYYNVATEQFEKT